MYPMLLNEVESLRSFATTSGAQQGHELAAGCENFILFPCFEVELGLRFLWWRIAFSLGIKVEKLNPAILKMSYIEMFLLDLCFVPGYLISLSEV